MRNLLAATLLAGATALAGCTGDPQIDNTAMGAAGGAVLGQLLGGDTGATVAGAAIGGIAGHMVAQNRRTTTAPAVTRAQTQPQVHPCQDIFDRNLHPEVSGDLCDARLSGVPGV